MDKVEVLCFGGGVDSTAILAMCLERERARINWSIGIEINEGNRRRRFTPPNASLFTYNYPLVELNIDRNKARTLLRDLKWPINVEKSSCYFCPFMTEQGIFDLQAKCPALWEECKTIEARFEKTSSLKHGAWIKAGKPLIPLKSGRFRAPVENWQVDSFKAGGRLFAKSMNGTRLSISEWENQFNAY